MKITNQSNITIIIPEDKTKREQFAAEELSKYLTCIFPGIQVRLVTDTTPASGDRILIGGPERNRAAVQYISQEDFDALVPGPEGMMIQSCADDVVLCAGSKHINECERGTLYAV